MRALGTHAEAGAEDLGEADSGGHGVEVHETTKAIAGECLHYGGRAMVEVAKHGQSKRQRKSTAPTTVLAKQE